MFLIYYISGSMISTEKLIQSFLKKVDLCLKMSSNFNYNFGFVVEQIFEHGYTIKSRCFHGLYKTWTPPNLDPVPTGPPYF